MGMRKLLLTTILFSCVSASAQSPLHKLIAKKQSATCLDADANAFIAAAGITDPTQMSAICTLVTDLKANSLWSPMIAIYPFVGGTASTHKWNLKDPRDLDAAFRLTFSGTWTHSSTGADPNGSNAYANTYAVPSTNLTNNDFHISYYSRESSTGVKEIFGSFLNGSNNIQFIINNSYTGEVSFEAYASATRATGDATNSIGYLVGSKTSSTSNTVYKNATSINTNTTSGGGVPNIALYLAAVNINGSAGLYTNTECAFTTIGAGITSGQVTTLNTIVEAFNDALGRGVQ